MMDRPEDSGRSWFTQWVTAMFVIFVIIPFALISKAVYQARTTVVSFQLGEDDIAFIALEENSWDGIDATGCRGHLSPDPIAVMDKGERALYTVVSDYRLPEPWVTPKYVWVRKYEDGYLSHNAVYDVFRTPEQVQEWAETHGYRRLGGGEFEFSLLKLEEEKPDKESDRPFARVRVPYYHKDRSIIGTVIFTHGARYAVRDGEVRESTMDDESFQIYERVAR
jgi:hypothetical protein